MTLPYRPPKTQGKGASDEEEMDRIGGSLDRLGPRLTAAEVYARDFQQIFANAQKNVHDNMQVRFTVPRLLELLHCFCCAITRLRLALQNTSKLLCHWNEISNPEQWVKTLSSEGELVPFPPCTSKPRTDAHCEAPCSSWPLMLTLLLINPHPRTQKARPNPPPAPSPPHPACVGTPTPSSST